MFPIDKKLVIAISSSALFDLGEADAVYRKEGLKAYREYQMKHENDILEKGVAFPFIQRLLNLNALPGEPVEVVLLSQNDPETGLRVMNSIEYYGLSISRAAFRKGRSPGDYLEAFNAKLFLSANEDDVLYAINHGRPAGLVLPSASSETDGDDELRIAFDFDGVLADDASEKIYQEQGLDSFQAHEASNAAKPLDPGPLNQLLEGLSAIQELEANLLDEDKDYQPKMRTAIFTARSAPAHKRVINSLRAWGVQVDEAFFLGGVEKARTLKEFRPHIFFDDQPVHTDSASLYVPSVRIPMALSV